MGGPTNAVPACSLQDRPVRLSHMVQYLYRHGDTSAVETRPYSQVLFSLGRTRDQDQDVVFTAGKLPLLPNVRQFPSSTRPGPYGERSRQRGTCRLGCLRQHLTRCRAGRHVPLVGWSSTLDDAVRFARRITKLGRRGSVR